MRLRSDRIETHLFAVFCEDSILLSRPLLAPRGTVGDEATRGQRNEEEREEKTQLGEAGIHSTEGHWKEYKNANQIAKWARKTHNVFVPCFFPSRPRTKSNFPKLLVAYNFHFSLNHQLSVLSKMQHFYENPFRRAHSHSARNLEKDSL